MSMPTEASDMAGYMGGVGDISQIPPPSSPFACLFEARWLLLPVQQRLMCMCVKTP